MVSEGETIDDDDDFFTFSLEGHISQLSHVVQELWLLAFLHKANNVCSHKMLCHLLVVCCWAQSRCGVRSLLAQLLYLLVND